MKKQLLWKRGLPKKDGIWVLCFLGGDQVFAVERRKGKYYNEFDMPLRSRELTGGYYYGPIPPPPKEETP